MNQSPGPGAIERIVVTGAAGRLGSALVERLTRQADLPILGIDRAEDPHLGIDYVQCELSDVETLVRSLRAGDLLVHLAAIHGFSAGFSAPSDDLYFDLNCKATWNLYSAAAKVGIRKVILTSTIGAFGADPDPVPFREYVESDSFPASIGIYGLSKHIQEEIAATFAHYSQMGTIALRPPAFIALDPVEAGIMLTTNYLLVDDILDAHVAAVNAVVSGRVLDSPRGVVEPIFVTNPLPYQPDDVRLLDADGSYLPLVEKYWPGSSDWLKGHGGGSIPEKPFVLFNPKNLPMVVNDERARRLLDWSPAVNFGSWFRDNATAL